MTPEVIKVTISLRMILRSKIKVASEGGREREEGGREGGKKRERKGERERGSKDRMTEL